MARKGIGMHFELSATLNNSYNATFRKAQENIATMQNGLQSLKKSQSDISAYTKQQKAVDTTKSKLANLQQQHNFLRKEIDETEGSTASLVREDLKLQRQIEATTSSLKTHERKMEQLSVVLKEAGVNTDNLEKESERLESEYKKLKTKQEEVAQSLEEGSKRADVFSEKSIKAITDLQQIILAAGIAKLLNEIGNAYTECVSAAGDLQEGMSNVEALSGANAEELAELSALAKGLGATTKFTATEAADAMGYMAMAGWDANEMLNGMDGVMQLAAASGEELATVADIVTDNLSAFGLQATDTAHFSDVLAAAATNSNTSVSIMGETFKTSASIAGALGYSIEDVAVAVGLMANSGVKGSIAGTALRNTFNGLLEGVTLTGAAFGEYEYSAVKADGTMKDFGSTIDELRKYFEQMTESERVNNAITIAGERGYNGLLAILNATDEDYTSLAASINNCTGAAEKMANIKLDNMNGQIVLMESAWDGLKIAVGEEFTPTMTDAYSIIADVIGVTTEFVQEHPNVIKLIAATTAGIAAAGTTLTGFVVTAKLAVLAQKALAMAMGVGTAGLAVVGVVGLTAALGTLIATLDDVDDEYKQLTAASRAQYDELQRLNAEYDVVCDKYGETSYEAQSLKWQIDDLTAAYEANKTTLTDFVAVNDALIESHENVVTEYQQNRSEIEKSAESNSVLIDKLYELASATEKTEASQEQMKAIIQALNNSVDGLSISYEDVIANTEGAVSAIRQAAAAQAEQERKAEKYRAYVDLLKEQTELEEQLQVAIESTAAAQQSGDWKAAKEYYTEHTRLAEALAETNRLIEESNEGWVNQNEIMDDLSSALSSVQNNVSELAATYTNAYNNAYTSIAGQIGLFDMMSVTVDKSVDDMIDSLESQVAYMETYAENLQKAADLGLDENLIAQLSDGSTESAAYLQAIVDGGKAKIEELNSALAEVAEGKKKFADNIAEVQTGFSEAMSIMEQELTDTISDMDLSEEAAESARSTIQGFIDSAAYMLPAVQKAYSDIAHAAQESLSLSGFNVSFDIPAYAGGTSYAKPGVALVGEKGPELVYFNGGEQVITASETAALQKNNAVSSRDISNNVITTKLATAENVVEDNTKLYFNFDFNISGNNSDDLMDKLGRSAENIRDVVRQTIEELKNDDDRRRY